MPTTPSPARTLWLSPDSCDPVLARTFAAEGVMPTFAQLLDEAAVVSTVGPIGYFVAGDWVTIATGTTPSRHQFLCAGQIVGGTYDWRWVGPISDPPPVWVHLSRAGMRVAALDVPHSAIPDELNGISITEWGGHDRHGPTRSYPHDLLDKVYSNYGEHPVCRVPHEHGRPHYSPCDYAHRAAPQRTHDESAALLADMLEGVRRKQALSLDLLDRGDWDLFVSVFSETHCSGHQFWKDHDQEHMLHDPALRARIGDPLRTVYAAVDAALGAHLERAGADTTVYVQLNHGMQRKADGYYVIDPVLWRLEQYLTRGKALGAMSRIADAGGSFLPASLRNPVFGAATRLRNAYSSTVPLGYFDEPIPPLARRLFWPQPNDSTVASIRINVEGREPNGRVRRSQRQAVASWLAERLRELVNVETGRPAVTDVVFTDDCYERSPGDAFGDLLVEWDRSALLETVWSPATGVVRVENTHLRTGDHNREGLLLVRGPGITPGRRPYEMWNIDVAPTIAASLGHDLTGVDGLAHADLVPTAQRRHATSVARPLLARSAPPPAKLKRRWPRRANVSSDQWLLGEIDALATAHHDTYLLAGRLRVEVDELADRVRDLDQLAAITQTTAWLRQIDVPESLLVSVVTPTRNRSDTLARAIESVQAQSYGHWEMLIVDDASADATPALIEKLAAQDDRLRGFRLEPHGGSCRARNHALDHARGDVVVYLDDDNRFDADWLRSVVWAFTEYPDVDVCYGARVIDDDDRHRRLPGRSLPIVQFLTWDREEELRANRVDQNVLAHRASAVRFDESLSDFMDWDIVLQLTDDKDPLPLPVLAAYYYTDIADRMTNRFLNEGPAYEYVRAKTMARRGDT